MAYYAFLVQHTVKLLCEEINQYSTFESCECQVEVFVEDELSIGDELRLLRLGNNIILYRHETKEIVLKISVDELDDLVCNALYDLRSDLEDGQNEQYFKNLSSHSSDQELAREIDHVSTRLKLNKDLISSTAVRVMEQLVAVLLEKKA